jgi:hypothetical protein
MCVRGIDCSSFYDFLLDFRAAPTVQYLFFILCYYYGRAILFLFHKMFLYHVYKHKALI